MSLHGTLFDALLAETDCSRQDADEFVRSWLAQLRDDGVVIDGDDDPDQ
jgi:hypothetical protein